MRFSQSHYSNAILLTCKGSWLPFLPYFLQYFRPRQINILILWRDQNMKCCRLKTYYNNKILSFLLVLFAILSTSQKQNTSYFYNGWFLPFATVIKPVRGGVARNATWHILLYNFLVTDLTFIKIMIFPEIYLGLMFCYF